ncbi:MAG: hypothetical protein JKY61_09105 [Planctomycetes bacterium]|nr:hypothetical protein [Planctomycetota bacterium]
MKRGALSLLLSSLAFAVGCWTCSIQAQNFDKGAELNKAQVEVEWYERRISGLRCRLSEYEWQASSADEALRMGLDKGQSETGKGTQ